MFIHLRVSRKLQKFVVLVQLLFIFGLRVWFLLYSDDVCFFFEVCGTDLYYQHVCLEISRAFASRL
jgi:hypothetical protein